MAIHETSELDCRKCNEAIKELRGCEKETGSYFVNGDEYKRCPLKLIHFQTWEAIKFFGFYDKGFLPTNDGLLEQTSKFIDVLSFIRREQYKYEQKRIKANGK